MTDIVFHHIRDLHFPLYAIAIGDGQRITGRKTKVHRQLLCDERTVVTQRELFCIAAVAKCGEVRKIIKIRRHDDRDRTVFSIIADRDGVLSDADGFFDLGIVLQTLQGVMQKVIGACRAEKGMTVVLEAGSALSYDQAADITSEIVTRLDQEKVDFGPLPSLEPAPAPEEDASADNAADAASAGEKPGASETAPADTPAKDPATSASGAAPAK